MTFSLWVLLTTINKIFVYASVACAIGGAFMSFLLVQHSQILSTIKRYIVRACTIGLLASISGFFVQVGALSDMGVAGMIDNNIMLVLFQTSVGDTLLLQVFGFFSIGFAYFFAARKSKKNSAFKFALFICSILGCLSLLDAFSQTGHLAEAEAFGKIAITLHVLTMSLWIGSLYPLWMFSKKTDVLEVKKAMVNFSHLAIIIIAVLVASGLIMAFILLNRWSEFIGSDYGHGLIVKLCFVTLLLSLAATNKWLLVPNIVQAGYSNFLSRAIFIEMILGGIILSITCVLTTIIGIEVKV